MNMNKPALSVITPVYNGADFVERCYKNLIEQSSDHWEWIVVDDGSTDGTADAVRKIEDRRVRLFSYGRNRGRGYARNLAIRESAGDWIVIWDIDDLNFPARFAAIEKARGLNYDFFCSYAVVVNNNMEIKGTRGFHHPLGCLPRGFVHPTLAVRKDIASKIGYKITRGEGGPAEDARMMWTLSSQYKGLWFEDALTIYQEDRDVNLRKAIDTNLAHLESLKELKNEGLFKAGYLYYLTLWRYFFKISILNMLRFQPGLYPKLMVWRDYGCLINGWTLSPEKVDFIKRHYTDGIVPHVRQ
jgi:glycosyltransferase involved in cell wall biosynthesis